jgi:hypothetical protein
MIRVVLVLVVIALLVYAFTDCATAPEEQTAGVPKIVWLAVVVLLPVVGPVTWLLVSRSAADGAAGRDGSGGPGRRRPGGRGPAGPVAPDDDPEFLRRLSEENRRAHGPEGSGDERG